DLKGIQIHHFVELSENPLESLHADNLIFARGQAATPGTLHNILHEMNELKAQGVKNPGRTALLNAVERNLIPASFLSPTLRSESANVKGLAKAAAIEETKALGQSARIARSVAATLTAAGVAGELLSARDAKAQVDEFAKQAGDEIVAPIVKNQLRNRERL